MARYQRKATLEQRRQERERRQNRRTTVADRWTEYLAGSGHVPVVVGFLDYYKQLGLSDTEAMFIIHLMSYKWDQDSPFPTYAKLAQVMHLKEASLRRLALRLETAGFLKRDRREGRSSRFDLTPLFKRLEQAIKDDQPQFVVSAEVPRKKAKVVLGPLDGATLKKIFGEQ